MTLSELCIRRPVMTTLITASIIAFGVFGFRLLPVSALPKVDFPTIAVTATLPGASADTMAASVAGIIERQLSTIAGISSMDTPKGDKASLTALMTAAGAPMAPPSPSPLALVIELPVRVSI